MCPREQVWPLVRAQVCAARRNFGSGFSLCLQARKGPDCECSCTPCACSCVIFIAGRTEAPVRSPQALPVFSYVCFLYFQMQCMHPYSLGILRFTNMHVFSWLHSCTCGYLAAAVTPKRLVFDTQASHHPTCTDLALAAAVGWARPGCLTVSAGLPWRMADFWVARLRVEGMRVFLSAFAQL